MSDYIPKDPSNPNLNSTDRRGNHPYGHAKFEPAADDGAGKGPYILLGLLVAICLIGGLLYFNGGAPRNGDVARAPAAFERTMPAPASPTLTDTTPKATPAPSAPAIDSGKPRQQ